GRAVGSAPATRPVGGAPTPVTTDGGGKKGGTATKTYVAAYIVTTPPQATNEVGKTHVFTATVFVNQGLGGGYVPAPDGTSITFAYVGAHVGTITTVNPCTTTGGTGACSVTTTSATAGVDTMSPTTTGAGGGGTPGGPVSLTRTTGVFAPGHLNSGNAVKTWVDENIQITPATAFNAVGTNHTLTGHVNVNPGTGFVNASDGTVITFTK